MVTTSEITKSPVPRTLLGREGDLLTRVAWRLILGGDLAMPLLEKSHTQGVFRGDHLFIVAVDPKREDKPREKLSHITAVGWPRTCKVLSPAPLQPPSSTETVRVQRESDFPLHVQRAVRTFQTLPLLNQLKTLRNDCPPAPKVTSGADGLRLLILGYILYLYLYIHYVQTHRQASVEEDVGERHSQDTQAV